MTALLCADPLTIFRNGDSPLPSARCRTNYGLAKVSSFLRNQILILLDRAHISQRRGMSALVVAVRVTRTGLRGQTADRRKLRPAVFAGVLRFFISLVKFVPAAMVAIRVTRTSLGRETVDRREPLSAVLAIVVRHFPFPFLFVWYGRQLHRGEARHSL